MTCIANKDLILNHMKENNLTKRQFCKLCGICPKTLNKFLEGTKHNYNIKALLKLALYLQVGIRQLFVEIDETEEPSPSV